MHTILTRYRILPNTAVERTPLLSTFGPQGPGVRLLGRFPALLTLSEGAVGELASAPRGTDPYALIAAQVSRAERWRYRGLWARESPHGLFDRQAISTSEILRAAEDQAKAAGIDPIRASQFALTGFAEARLENAQYLAITPKPTLIDTRFMRRALRNLTDATNAFETSHPLVRSYHSFPNVVIAAQHLHVAQTAWRIYADSTAAGQLQLAATALSVSSPTSNPAHNAIHATIAERIGDLHLLRGASQKAFEHYGVAAEVAKLGVPQLFPRLFERNQGKVTLLRDLSA